LTLFDPALFATTEAGEGSTGSAWANGGTEAGKGEAGPAPDHLDPPVRADRPVTVRLRLSIAYDGSGFRGFAVQRGQRTVAGELCRAISAVARHEVEITCAGRTDAGVHALGQVIHVDVPAGLTPQRVTKAVNSMLGPEIVVRSASVTAGDFDARRSALARWYRYTVLNSESPLPLLAPMTWHVRDRLDVRSMSAGADCLLGEHDFAAFCRRPRDLPADQPIVRRVTDARWSRSNALFPYPGAPAGRSSTSAGCPSADELLCFDICAQSFCHQMVRSIVGTLVEVGRGRRKASDLVWLLASGDRLGVRSIAPPQGLCLMGVEYA
jgi:tRNA pseudouridine38-40 synthase